MPFQISQKAGLTPLYNAFDVASIKRKISTDWREGTPVPIDERLQGIGTISNNL